MPSTADPHKNTERTYKLCTSASFSYLFTVALPSQRTLVNSIVSRSRQRVFFTLNLFTCSRRSLFVFGFLLGNIGGGTGLQILIQRDEDSSDKHPVLFYKKLPPKIATMQVRTRDVAVRM